MASVFVTGSTDGIGAEVARSLVRGGHRVVLHARNEERAEVARTAVPGAAAVAVGDVASLRETIALAEAANGLGTYDAVVHNVGVGRTDARTTTDDGLERIFQVNVLAPYVLTALMPMPARLVYLSSGLQAQGVAVLDDLHFERREWQGFQAYCDSKLYDVMLAFAVARLHTGVRSNAVNPGWVRTRMGGAGAPDDLADGAATSVWLAVSDEPGATVTGRLLERGQTVPANPAASDVALQDGLLRACAEMSGVELPAA
ncbi:MAG: SDR family NAD(P)-dependent oxidoreductase [Micromonosporaceae bacterium]